MSDRVSQKGDQSIIVRKDSAQEQLSRLCLIYLLSIDEYAPSRPQGGAFLKYASCSWYVHSRRIRLANNQAVLNLLFSLFKSEKLHNVLRVHNPDHQRPIKFSRLYLSSFLGFTEICEELLNARNNAQGGETSSHGSQKGIGKLLLQSGAEVNAQGGYYGNALQAASQGGHEAIVRLLLQSGADVNAQGGVYCNALQAASQNGHEGIVRSLLQSGADVNAQGGEYGNALQAASYVGHEGIVRLLLQSGADVNAQEGRYGNALQAASRLERCKGSVELSDFTSKASQQD